VNAAGPRWVAGVVSHDSYTEIAACLPTVAAQTLAPDGIFVADTAADADRLAALAEAHPSARFEARPNLGWGAGVNRVLAWTTAEHPAAEFVLLLNPDVELAPDFAAILATACARHPHVAFASGKLLRGDGATLDSAGIRLPRHRRPRDRGSEEPDTGRYDRPEFVFGVSGAAMWIRRSALADLAIDGEFADEDFFAYHDDTDLCWRAHLLGWEVLYEPAARGVHHRGWQRRRRHEIAPAVRRHSFKNHYLQIIKNERGIDLLRNAPVLLAWELLRFGFALAADRAILRGYADAWRAAPTAFRKRRILMARARGRDGSVPLRARDAIAGDAA
jgi:GT2 family glycosyltransferase